RGELYSLHPRRTSDPAAAAAVQNSREGKPTYLPVWALSLIVKIPSDSSSASHIACAKMLFKSSILDFNAIRPRVTLVYKSLNLPVPDKVLISPGFISPCPFSVCVLALASMYQSSTQHIS